MPMAEEIKPTPEGDAPEPKEDVENPEGEGGAAKEAPKETLEELLQRERELGRKEGAAKVAFQQRKEKREEPKEEEDEDRPLTTKRLEEIMAREREVTKKELASQALRQEFVRKSGGDSVIADLALEIFKNRSFPESLSLEEQTEEVFAIALSKPSVKARLEERKRAQNSKDTASDFAVGTHRDSPALEEPKTSSADVSALKASGFQWDGKSRLYVKKLQGNKTLTYDPKTKTQKVI